MSADPVQNQAKSFRSIFLIMSFSLPFSRNDLILLIHFNNCTMNVNIQMVHFKSLLDNITSFFLIIPFNSKSRQKLIQWYINNRQCYWLIRKQWTECYFT